MASWRLLEAQRRPGRSTEHAKLSNNKKEKYKNMLVNHIQTNSYEENKTSQISDFKKKLHQ
jgi:hypothetical protein